MRNRQNDDYCTWSQQCSQSKVRCQQPLIQLDASLHRDVKFNLAGSRADLSTEFLVTTVTAMGERQQRTKTASELGIVFKGPDRAMIMMTVVNTNPH